MKKYGVNQDAPTTAWVIQGWVSFVLSISATSFGILNLPADGWVKGYMGMGVLFSVGSTFSLAKTSRDVHESKRLISRVDEAKLEKMLTENDPFNK